MLGAHLRHAGYEVTTARNAPEAEALLRREGPDQFAAIVSDYWMPGGTGLDLLHFVRGSDPTLAVLIVTAEGEKDMVANILRAGAQGYIEKPVQKDPLRKILADLVGTTREQRRLRDAASAAVAVGRSQMILLNRQAAKLGNRVQVFFQPQNEASGDFVSVVPLPEGDYMILASDVSGHDMKAAYQSSYFHGLARGIMSQGAAMTTVFKCYNDILLANTQPDNVVELSLAAFALRVNAQAGEVHSINAGFPPPWLVNSEGWGSRLGGEPGSPLGWFELEPRLNRQCAPGGQIVFWSDGLDDLAEQLNVDPLSLAHRLCEDQSENPARYTRLATDDILVVRTSLDPIRPVGELPKALLDQTYAGDKLSEINAIQTRAEASLRLALPDLADETLADVTVCLREALINALKHGCRGQATGQARVQAVYVPSTRLLRLRICDSGPGHEFDHQKHAVEAAEQLLTEHRGLLMISNIPKRTNFSGNGAIVTMEFEI